MRGNIGSSRRSVCTPRADGPAYSYPLMPHRIALLLTGVAWATVAFGQSPAPPSAPIAGTSPGATAPIAIAPSGSGLLTGNPASPLPNPDLTSGAAFPARRGFVRAEPFFIYPFLGVGIGYNDNLTGVPDHRIGSAFLVVSPRVQAVAQSGSDVYAFTYSGNYGHYFSTSASDFNEQAFVATSSNQFTARADLQAAAFYLVKQDPFGSIDRSFNGVPFSWHGGGANATFGYGAPSAEGRLELTLALPTNDTRTNARLRRPSMCRQSTSPLDSFIESRPRPVCWPRSAVPSTITARRRRTTASSATCWEPPGTSPRQQAVP